MLVGATVVQCTNIACTFTVAWYGSWSLRDKGSPSSAQSVTDVLKAVSVKG